MASAVIPPLLIFLENDFRHKLKQGHVSDFSSETSCALVMHLCAAVSLLQASLSLE